jgi:formylglycine-generating enzyme required for sulfatase activity
MTHTNITPASHIDIPKSVFSAILYGKLNQILRIGRAGNYYRGQMAGNFMKIATVYIPFFLLTLSAQANNITLSTPSLTDENRSQGYIFVTFDLSWENSWRESTGAANWDAAWVFVKYRIAGGEWQHAKLHNSGHLAGAGTPATVSARLVDDDMPFELSGNPGVGVFIHRSADGVGAFTNTGVKLRWNYSADGIIDGASVEVRVFAIEMVYVREGAFNVGGGGGNNAFLSTTISTADATATPTGSGTLGGAAGGYPTGQIAPAYASWPNGYNAFYCMKYEVTNQQYVNFINTSNGYVNQNSLPALVYPFNGHYDTTLPYVAAKNYIGAAYADWSCLRPMTELEFEKACRGDQPPVSGEYAWGTADIANDYTLSNQGAANEGISSGYSTNKGNALRTRLSGLNGPIRVGIFAANVYNSGRVTSGASYWGILELSGNASESCISIDGGGQSSTFTGKNGDGVLTSDNTSYEFRDILWIQRGGAFSTYQQSYLTVSSRSQDAYNDGVGFRAVRR